MKKRDESSKLIEIWGDVVDIRSMGFAFLISVVTTMGLYFLAPEGSRPMQLLLGLSGAVLGFVINAVLFKP